MAETVGVGECVIVGVLVTDGEVVWLGVELDVIEGV